MCRLESLHLVLNYHISEKGRRAKKEIEVERSDDDVTRVCVVNGN